MAERIAELRGSSKQDLDTLGVLSQERAATAWAEGRFEREVLPVEAAQRDKEGDLTGESMTVVKDQGLRDTTMDSLANLKPVSRVRCTRPVPRRRSPTAPPPCSGWTRTWPRPAASSRELASRTTPWSAPIAAGLYIVRSPIRQSEGVVRAAAFCIEELDGLHHC